MYRYARNTKYLISDMLLRSFSIHERNYVTANRWEQKNNCLAARKLSRIVYVSVVLVHGIT